MGFPEFCEPLLQIIETEEEVGHGNPQFVVKSDRSVDDMGTHDLQLASEVGEETVFRPSS